MSGSERAKRGSVTLHLKLGEENGDEGKVIIGAITAVDEVREGGGEVG